MQSYLHCNFQGHSTLVPSVFAPLVQQSGNSARLVKPACAVRDEEARYEIGAMAIRIRYVWNSSVSNNDRISNIQTLSVTRSSPQSPRIFLYFLQFQSHRWTKWHFLEVWLTPSESLLKESLVSHSQGVVWPSLWFCRGQYGLHFYLAETLVKTKPQQQTSEVSRIFSRPGSVKTWVKIK